MWVSVVWVFGSVHVHGLTDFVRSEIWHSLFFDQKRRTNHFSIFCVVFSVSSQQHQCNHHLWTRPRLRALSGAWVKGWFFVKCNKLFPCCYDPWSNKYSPLCSSWYVKFNLWSCDWPFQTRTREHLFHPRQLLVRHFQDYTTWAGSQHERKENDKSTISGCWSSVDSASEKNANVSQKVLSILHRLKDWYKNS